MLPRPQRKAYRPGPSTLPDLSTIHEVISSSPRRASAGDSRPPTPTRPGQSAVSRPIRPDASTSAGRRRSQLFSPLQDRRNRTVKKRGKINRSGSKVLVDRNGRFAVVKEVSRDFILTDANLRGVKRFLDYKHLVGLVDWDWRRGRQRICFYEFCDSGSLREKINMFPNGLPESFIWHVLKGLLKATLYMHTGVKYGQSQDPVVEDWRPCIHNLINPDNIHFQRTDYDHVPEGGPEFRWTPRDIEGPYPLVKLTNFTKTRLLDSINQEHWDLRKLCVAYEWMTHFEAPEMVWNTNMGAYKTRSDMWSIGAVAVAMMGGIPEDVEPKLPGSRTERLSTEAQFTFKTLQRYEDREDRREEHLDEWMPTDLPEKYSKYLRLFVVEFLKVRPRERVDAEGALQLAFAGKLAYRLNLGKEEVGGVEGAEDPGDHEGPEKMDEGDEGDDANDAGDTGGANDKGNADGADEGGHGDDGGEGDDGADGDEGGEVDDDGEKGDANGDEDDIQDEELIENPAEALRKAQENAAKVAELVKKDQLKKDLVAKSRKDAAERAQAMEAKRAREDEEAVKQAEVEAAKRAAKAHRDTEESRRRQAVQQAKGPERAAEESHRRQAAKQTHDAKVAAATATRAEQERKRIDDYYRKQVAKLMITDAEDAHRRRVAERAQAEKERAEKAKKDAEESHPRTRIPHYTAEELARQIKAFEDEPPVTPDSDDLNEWRTVGKRSSSSRRKSSSKAGSSPKRRTSSRATDPDAMDETFDDPRTIRVPGSPNAENDAMDETFDDPRTIRVPDSPNMKNLRSDMQNIYNPERFHVPGARQSPPRPRLSAPKARTQSINEFRVPEYEEEEPWTPPDKMSSGRFKVPDYTTAEDEDDPWTPPGKGSGMFTSTPKRTHGFRTATVEDDFDANDTQKRSRNDHQPLMDNAEEETNQTDHGKDPPQPGAPRPYTSGFRSSPYTPPREPMKSRRPYVQPYSFLGRSRKPRSRSPSPEPEPKPEPEPVPAATFYAQRARNLARIEHQDRIDRMRAERRARKQRRRPTGFGRASRREREDEIDRRKGGHPRFS